MRPKIIVLFFLLVSLCSGAPFELELNGVPVIRLTLDREYEVIEIGRKDGAPANLRLYMLNPKDGQSSAVLALGSGGHNKTEQSIAAMFEGAKVTKVDGRVAGKKIQWWHYRDSHHLYSTCAVTLANKKGADIPTYFDLVANSPERLAALEESFSKIEFRE